MPVFFLLFAVVVVRIASIFITHFPMASIQPRHANIWMEVFRMMVPLLTWILACYAMTTILDGETLLRETMAAAAYSMLPYILFVIPLSLLSHVMQNGEAALYGNLHNIVWIWVLLLFFISVKTLNEYNIGKTVLICVLSIVTMLLIWGITALFFAMSSQLYQFINGIMLEIKMLFLQ